MDFVNLPLFAAAALVFASVLTGLFSARIGFSFLLVFLVAGMLAGEDGPGRYLFDDYRLAFWVGNLALAVILLDGGLRTAWATFRTGLRPASLLASLGVLVCAGVTALAGMWAAGLDWRTALLLGAIVGSTDAAAVFGLLNRSGVTLNERIGATLEIESGVNDPMAVYLTLAFIALLMPGASAHSAAGAFAMAFVQQFGWGALAGVLGGFAMAGLLNRVASRDAGGGVLALLIGAGGLLIFATAGMLGGSGFLAVYLFGIILARRAARAVKPTLAAMDGYAWLAQAGMFLLLGLLVTPSDLLDSLLPAVAVSLTLIFIARPLAVWVCLRPLHFSTREIGFIAWVGLRGAVPIVLALFPLMAGTPKAALLFNMAFVVVVTSLLIQGTTIGLVARRLGVALPDADDEPARRAVFGDFEFDAGLPVGRICDFYALPLPTTPEVALGDWMAEELLRPPVAGDTVELGSAAFVVRTVESGRITRVGLSLQDSEAA
ncbi:MAG: potassium/proton antiporter [Burkholderiaceae bacterium]|nr:potassium/proton antiporter [Burkholderiaceae bacterium]